MSEPVTYQPAPQPQAPQESTGKKIAKGIGAALLWRLVIGGIVVIIGLGFAGYKYLQGDPTVKTPSVGDCITDSADADNMKVVGCTEATAVWKVAGIVDGSYGDSQKQDETHPCMKFGDSWESALWIGKVKGVTPKAADTGKIYCLGKK
ncbi:hypothetical protein AB0H43_02750 [Hamadaea sp. NPDC050747]|uniref:LppU/SCO3897 family protein n=1 Tax=Hamadaea sp. NPDC050747 TaxID=3155789 RepID=UPI0033F8D430